MTEALQQVWEELQQLDPAFQDEVALRLRGILEELEEDQKWERTFASPAGQAVLAKLKAQAQVKVGGDGRRSHECETPA